MLFISLNITLARNRYFHGTLCIAYHSTPELYVDAIIKYCKLKETNYFYGAKIRLGLYDVPP